MSCFFSFDRMYITLPTSLSPYPSPCPSHSLRLATLPAISDLVLGLFLKPALEVVGSSDRVGAALVGKEELLPSERRKISSSARLSRVKRRTHRPQSPDSKKSAGPSSDPKTEVISVVGERREVEDRDEDGRGAERGLR